MAVSWSYFDKFEEVSNKYMESYGEGETVASQIVTAVNKLVYKWYNDGDVFDNTSAHGLSGWVNDLSSYANWLVSHTHGKADCLFAIFDIEKQSEYEKLLKELADTLLDEEWLSKMEAPKEGSIYDCKGPFKFEVVEDEFDEYDADEDDDNEW